MIIIVRHVENTLPGKKVIDSTKRFIEKLEEKSTNPKKAAAGKRRPDVIGF